MRLLRDPAFVAPIAANWRAQAVSQGRPSIAMEVYVRLMVINQPRGDVSSRLMGSTVMTRSPRTDAATRRTSKGRGVP